MVDAADLAGAAAAYEKVIAADGPRASVYYNLGNSYQQLKQYGPAILAWLAEGAAKYAASGLADNRDSAWKCGTLAAATIGALRRGVRRGV